MAEAVGPFRNNTTVKFAYSMCLSQGRISIVLPMIQVVEYTKIDGFLELSENLVVGCFMFLTSSYKSAPKW